MTLTDILSQVPGMTDADAKSYALVFNSEHYDALARAQQSRPEAKHRVSPVQLTDGRWLLCADLLMEISVNGLYADGFALLPPALFGQVEVVPWEDAIVLLPPIREFP